MKFENLKKKNFILMMTVVILFSLCLSIIPQKVQANSIMPFAYYDPNSVSFNGTYRGVSNYYDGNYMAFESKATASDGISREVIITVYISSTNTTKKYKTYTDGVTRKADYIPIGNGSYALISATCADSSVTINLDLKMYSW